MSTFEQLVEHASIRIYQYGIHHRNEMNSINRVLPYYVMSYLSRGHALLRIGSDSYALEPKSIIIIPPYTRHDHVMDSNGESTFLWWHFDYKIYDTIDLLSLLRLPVTFQVRDFETFEMLYQRYHQSVSYSPSIRNSLLKRAAALEVMAHLLGEVEEENMAHDLYAGIPHPFREMLDLILGGDINNLTLNYLSQRYNMHPTYISNRFTHFYGVSPIKLYKRLQVERIKEVLQRGDKSIAEVAEMFGYSDSSAFSKYFAASVGCAPSEYARRGADAPNTSPDFLA